MTPPPHTHTLKEVYIPDAPYDTAEVHHRLVLRVVTRRVLYLTQTNIFWIRK